MKKLLSDSAVEMLNLNISSQKLNIMVSITWLEFFNMKLFTVAIFDWRTLSTSPMLTIFLYFLSSFTNGAVLFVLFQMQMIVIRSIAAHLVKDEIVTKKFPSESSSIIYIYIYPLHPLPSFQPDCFARTDLANIFRFDVCLNQYSSTCIMVVFKCHDALYKSLFVVKCSTGFSIAPVYKQAKPTPVLVVFRIFVLQIKFCKLTDSALADSMADIFIIEWHSPELCLFQTQPLKLNHEMQSCT
ncbi:hypothetical protein T4B_2916 [Trichinella pseudospiralis]|uniref:Uncharacterized protein n=1 Tax=Trichinella pseudospiralis TaxID=6337 RepID=A0A0V1J7Z8_TRIPS|nr:hypothetical protein T4B_2916 [Trichinella pseudospiralis]